MANRHFGNVGDVWKHLVLAEVLTREHPRGYWETHAGSASYPLSRSPAREYGIYWFLQRASASSAILESPYHEEIGRLPRDSATAPTIYPGSALLAMRVLKDEANYLFCDLDSESIATLSEAAHELRLDDNARVVQSDGLKTVREAAHNYEGDPAHVLVHIDPFDPFEEGPAGVSAIALASELRDHGFKVFYWYGFELPERRAWPWQAIPPKNETRWCGDMIAQSALDGALDPVSDLNEMIGSGVLCLNIAPETAVPLTNLGNEFAALYGGAVLPSGKASGLDFLELASPRPSR